MMRQAPGRVGVSMPGEILGDSWLYNDKKDPILGCYADNCPRNTMLGAFIRQDRSQTRQ